MATEIPSIVVRMYNVGFGDCFLLKFPCDGKLQKVLIDCGTIATASMSMQDVVESIIEEVKDDDDVPRIDLVVCTHRHADHVSGFADRRWVDVEVREVWMPWTEDPKDPDAKRIRETQSRLALALESAWSARLAAGARDPEIEGFHSIAVNALTNECAMQTLHKGFKGKPERKFLNAPAAGMELVETSALRNVSAYVLGPFRNEDVIRDMDPPAGKTYLKQAAGGRCSSQQFDPFAEWAMTAARFQWSDLIVPPADIEQLKALSDSADPSITVSLDKAVNGTSLVLVFEIGSAVLLFPGDAQWGTWKVMLENDEAKELLSRATFFKVGHHGSHNATPKDFVNGILRQNCCAMMSTKAGKWQSIPRQPLLDALAAKTTLARSDDVASALPVPPFSMRSKTFTEARIPLS